MLNEFARKGKTIVHFTQQFPSDPLRADWKRTDSNLEWFDGQGDVSYVCNNAAIAEIGMNWLDSTIADGMPPMTIDDVGEQGTDILLKEIRENQREIKEIPSKSRKIQRDSVEINENSRNSVEINENSKKFR